MLEPQAANNHIEALSSPKSIPLPTFYHHPFLFVFTATMDHFSSSYFATIAATRSELENMPVDEEKSSGGLCVITRAAFACFRAMELLNVGRTSQPTMHVLMNRVSIISFVILYFRASIFLPSREVEKCRTAAAMAGHGWERKVFLGGFSRCSSLLL